MTSEKDLQLLILSLERFNELVLEHLEIHEKVIRLKAEEEALGFRIRILEAVTEREKFREKLLQRLKGENNANPVPDDAGPHGLAGSDPA